jgi:phosphoribosylglycinamide formyltransferase-1
MNPLYVPQSNRPMRVAVLFSGGASALKYLLENDPHLNVSYQFVAAFTDVKDAPGIEIARRASIPIEILDYRDFLRERQAHFKDLRVRREYFAQVVGKISKWQPDILIHSGFLLIVTDPLLSAYRHRILNVHPADLTVLDEKGRRKYLGMDAVRRAIEAGEKQTRSTIHLVTAEVDRGPIVVLSDPLLVSPGVGPKLHQEKMKWACDGPAYQRALELVADGRVWIDEATERVEIR